MCLKKHFHPKNYKFPDTCSWYPSKLPDWQYSPCDQAEGLARLQMCMTLPLIDPNKSQGEDFLF